MPNASALAGSLIVGGFEGTSVPPSFVAALRRGERAGAIVFKRNLPSLEAARAITVAVREATPGEPPLLAIDQEGGRVVRLPAPAPRLPAMRLVAALPRSLVRRAAFAVGADLAALGYNLDFAPILDVDSNPANPIIGDRAFGTTVDQVIDKALAFAEGLADAGIIACGKHFPGHGDTDLDSHLALPSIPHPRSRLDAVELAPFRAAARAGLPSFMSAHLVASALDAEIATFSRAVCTDLLRGELGFQGVLFSDDLEMMAVAATHEVEASSVRAIAAGCDALLICKSEALQDRAHVALVREIEASPAFAARATEAAERMRQLRILGGRAHAAAPVDTSPIWREVEAALATLADAEGGPA